MRAVIQRVKHASVSVDGEIVSKIGPGLLCLIGCEADDAEHDADYICRKVLNTRLFKEDGTNRAWSKSVKEIDGEVLLVSQFTLHAQLRGRKPDFHRAMPPQEASAFYERFVERVRVAYDPKRVQDGIFGAMMDVKLENEGPVTVILDSRA